MHLKKEREKKKKIKSSVVIHHFCFKTGASSISLEMLYDLKITKYSDKGQGH